MPEVKRMDIWIADLGQRYGHEQRGRRPVLILQNDLGNKFSPTVIVAAMTSEFKRDMPTHVYLPAGIVRDDSTMLFEQIQTIDKRKLIRKIGRLPKELEATAEQALKISIGLSPIPRKDAAV